LNVTTERIKALRGRCGAGIMECRNALLQAEGDIDKALEILKQQSLAKVEKKKQRTAAQGLVEAYIHTGGRIGPMNSRNWLTNWRCKLLLANPSASRQKKYQRKQMQKLNPPVCFSSPISETRIRLFRTLSMILLPNWVRILK
jgi:hypothetical protein